METMSLTTLQDIPMEAAPSFIERAFLRICKELDQDSADWSKMAGQLRKFQDGELLDNPSAAKLEFHRTTLKSLIYFGEFILQATKDPNYPNKETHKMVTATLEILRDDLIIWHGKSNSPEKNAEILAACFPE